MELTEDILYFWFSSVRFSRQKKYEALKKYSVSEIYEMTGKNRALTDYFGQENSDNLVKNKKAGVIEKKLDELYSAGAGFISINDPRFPELLKENEVIPPVGLYFKGDADLLKTVSVAVVGTRRNTEYGRETALKLSADLCAYNITVVSGMATGIDMYAHRGALDARGKTVAVLASGVNMPTPRSNYGLYNEIVKSGVVVSEYPLSMDAAKYTFPERNRIISGLSRKCIVVEADKDSGSLITAERAYEQHREIFAVPGAITAPKSEGTNLLIKNKKASLLTSVKDILSDFNLEHIEISQKKLLPALDFFEQTIYNLLKNSENYALSLDRISEMSGYSLPETLNLAFSLEMKDVIIRRPNNIIELAREYI